MYLGKNYRRASITEIVRYMAWLAVRNNDYSGCRFHIVTGPRINLAEDLIDRLHNLFINKLGVDCKSVGPILYVNNVIIQAFPSHTVSTMRGYTDLSFIFIDEGAFFITSQQEEVGSVCEGYRAKTNPKIIVVSTPWEPIGFFYDIDNNPNSAFW